VINITVKGNVVDLCSLCVVWNRFEYKNYSIICLTNSVIIYFILNILA